ncbi:alkaline phosphatase [Sporomusa acidovorans]|uniref:Alkaline phosphatase 4 n=1 Tax=Sporomusa acidovorans (strain ATCC 49682 / DSM 3132 / Mol) TaxID=1123286 RepID=A0ABZ3IWD5_SPOA4|nr:alkaline phosphatase [Sporomusa acidovorans]OZC15235.1 alkaline phosphatase 4 precursor [Sporomusa acidovorans DSM 3132]SDE90731.1 alkaline phosphatase [Sporomusa acidovorans]
MNKRIKWVSLSVAIIVLIAVVLVAALPQQQIANASVDNGYAGKKAKYVFFFIGDGMAMPQVNAAEIFKGTLESDNKMHKGKLAFTVFPYQGMQTTQSNNTFITESAAAGTALATGHKTNNDILGMDETKTVKFKTMAELAKEKGMKVGIVSNVSIDHATPGAFYAHEPTRKNYYEIGLALANSGFDYFAGGGLLAPTGPKRDKTSIFDIAKNNGYKVVNTQAEFTNLSKQDGKVFAVAEELAAEAAMPYDIDSSSGQVTLADLTRKGIELLDNSQGFFLMVEGGKIDWSCHANDAATTVRDVLAFDNAISEALKFYAKHPNETLIVVTGDHETGGMSIGFAGTEYETFFSKIDNQNLSFEEFDKRIKAYRNLVGEQNGNLNDWLPILADNFGLTDLTDYDKSRLKSALAASMVDPKKRGKDPASYLLYGPYEPFSVTVTHILNQKAGIGWTTYAHTGVAVPVFAQGVGGDLFQGYYDNTDIAKKIMNIMGVKPQ